MIVNFMAAFQLYGYLEYDPFLQLGITNWSFLSKLSMGVLQNAIHDILQLSLL